MIGVKEIQDIIQDIGLKDPIVVNASIEWGRKRIGESPDLPAEDLQVEIACYAHGYQDGLATHGLR